MLVGKKVILEEIDPKNLEQLRLWRNDPSLRKYFREYRDITKDQQEAWYKERGNNSNPEHVYFQIMAKDLSTKFEDDQVSRRYLIGCMGLHYISFGPVSRGEFGLFLGSDRGTGRGKEALQMLCKYGFEELNLHKIWCEVYDNNDSINLYKKIGFKEEGVLRDNYYNEGKYGNSIIMSMLRREWDEKNIKIP